MLEKIVLISVAYFCIATEMRFLKQRGPSQQHNSISKKDSEMYHAKALHISSIFLPKDCPLVQHISQSYNKNYLKDKPKEFNLDDFLKELGVRADKSEDHSGSSFENNDFDEGLQENGSKINIVNKNLNRQQIHKQPKKLNIKIKDSISVKRGSLKPSASSVKRITPMARDRVQGGTQIKMPVSTMNTA